MNSFRDYILEAEEAEIKATKNKLHTIEAITSAANYISKLEKEEPNVLKTGIQDLTNGSDLRRGKSKEIATAMYILGSKTEHTSKSPHYVKASELYKKYKPESITSAEEIFNQIEKYHPKEVINILGNITKQGTAPTTATATATAEAPAPEPAKEAASASEKEAENNDEENGEEDDSEESKPEEDNGVEAPEEETPDRYAGKEPKDIAAKIEAMSKAEVEKLAAKAKEDPRSQRIYAAAQISLVKKLRDYAEQAEKQQSRYSVHATPLSKQKAMSAAQIAFNNAQGEVSIINNKYLRKQIGSTASLVAKGALGALKNAKDSVKGKIDNSQFIQSSKDLVKQGAGNATDTIKRGYRAGKEGLERGVNNYMDKDYSKRQLAKDKVEASKETPTATPEKAASTKETQAIANKVNEVKPAASPANAEVAAAKTAVKNTLDKKVVSPAEKNYKEKSRQERVAAKAVDAAMAAKPEEEKPAPAPVAAAPTPQPEPTAIPIVPSATTPEPTPAPAPIPTPAPALPAPVAVPQLPAPVAAAQETVKSKVKPAKEYTPEEQEARHQKFVERGKKAAATRKAKAAEKTGDEKPAEEKPKKSTATLIKAKTGERIPAVRKVKETKPTEEEKQEASEAAGTKKEGAVASGRQRHFTDKSFNQPRKKFTPEETTEHRRAAAKKAAEGRKKPNKESKDQGLLNFASVDTSARKISKSIRERLRGIK